MASSYFQEDYERFAGVSTRGRREPYRGTVYGQPWPRHPIPVYCGPWASNTIDLQTAGWSFAVQQNVEYRSHDIVMASPYRKAMAIFRIDDSDMVERRNMPLTFQGDLVEKAALPERIFNGDWRFPDMKDAFHCEMEVMHGMRHFDPRDLFPQSEKAGEDGKIILPDTQTVKDALDLVLALQEPRQKEIRRNQKVREHQHAKIVTLEKIA